MQSDPQGAPGPEIETAPVPPEPSPVVAPSPFPAPPFIPPVAAPSPFATPITGSLPLPAPVIPAPPPAPRRPASVAFLVVVTVISLAADLVSKGWAKAALSGADPKTHGLRKVEIVKNHVDFIFAQNPGGAWSFLRSLPDSLRRPFFLVVSAAAIVFIVTIYQRVYRDQTSMKWGLPLALGGAMGNLVDRIRYGWVVDFIDFSARWGGRDHHWPTFNVADIAIVVGVALMAIDMLRSRSLPVHDDAAAVPHPLTSPGAPQELR